MGDQATAAAVIQNNTDRKLIAAPLLNVSGLKKLGRLEKGKIVRGPPKTKEISAKNQTRVEWQVKAEAAGEAVFRSAVASGNMSDAAERRYPVYPHGIEKSVSRSGRIIGDRGEIRFNLPKERRKHSSSLSIRVAPSIAATLLDALPYLIDYPYGCVEQTISRALPSTSVPADDAGQLAVVFELHRHGRVLDPVQVLQLAR